MDEMKEVKKMPQVAEQVNRLQDELTRLDEVISKLRARLVSVLKERQLKVGEPEAEPSPLVPLANSLGDCVQRATISVSEIVEIIVLLEV